MAYITPPRSYPPKKGQHIDALVDIPSFYNIDLSRSLVNTTIPPLTLFTKLAPVDKSNYLVSRSQKRIHQLLTISRSTNSIIRVGSLIKMNNSNSQPPSDSAPGASRQSSFDVNGPQAFDDNNMTDYGYGFGSDSDDSQGSVTVDAHRTSNITLESGRIATVPQASVRAESSIQSLYNEAAEIRDDGDRRSRLYGTGPMLRRARIVDEVLGGFIRVEPGPIQSRSQNRNNLTFANDYHDGITLNRLSINKPPSPEPSINKPLPPMPSRPPPPPPGVPSGPSQISSVTNIANSSNSSTDVGGRIASSRIERLSRPTASSAARAATQTRKFYRRKPAATTSTAAAESSTSALPKSRTLASVTKGIKGALSSLVKQRHAVETTLGTPYESNVQGPFPGELTDKMERNSDRADRESTQARATDAHVNDAVNAGLAPLGLAAAFRSGDDGDDPHNPRNLLQGGPLGHYGVEVEEPEPTPIDHLLRTAQRSLDDVLATASTITDDGIRGRMASIVESLGVAIAAVRDAQIATVALEGAVRNLAELVNGYAGEASRAARG